MRWKLIFSIFFAALFIIGTFSWYLAPASSNLPNYGSIPTFNLIDETGQNFNSNNLNGEISVINFFFTRCPHICPMVNAKVSQIQSQYLNNSQVAFLSISVDPEYDTPQVLAAYALKFSARGPNWHFLTGKPEQINTLLDQTLHLGSISDRDAHTTRLVLVDQNQVVRGFYPADTAEGIEQLKNDLNSLFQ